jgi:rhomboid protease GluP
MEGEYGGAEAKREPVVTFSLLVAMIIVFCLEGGSGAFASRAPAKFIELGGAYGPLVLERGEWWRLFSAVFLHASFVHIIFNAIALVFAGYVLEPVLGRVWFAAVFAVSGIAGGLLSVWLNADGVVSVGASGAIMGLFAAALLLSLRYEWESETSRNLQSGAVRVLIPSLIPSFSGKVDIVAHFGGAVAGGALGLALLVLWSEREPRPPFESAAAALAILGLCGAIFSFAKVAF